jgi:hypothetical protein
MLKRLVENLIAWWIIFIIIPLIVSIYFIKLSELFIWKYFVVFILLLFISEHVHNYLRRNFETNKKSNEKNSTDGLQPPQI